MDGELTLVADVVVEVRHFPRPVASVRDEGLPSLGALDLYVLPVQAEAGFDAVALERGSRTVSDAKTASSLADLKGV